MSEDYKNTKFWRLADRMVRLGRPVFPLVPDTKLPYANPEGTPPGMGGYKLATGDPAQLKAWALARPDALVGLPGGAGINPSDPHLVICDLDVGKGKNGPGNFKKALAKLGLTPKSIGLTIISTPSGGKHIMGFVPPGKSSVSTSGLKELSGATTLAIDMRGDTGYVLAPGNVTSRGEYKHVAGPWLSQKPMFPEKLIKVLSSSRARENYGTELDTPYGGEFFDDDHGAVAAAANYLSSLPVDGDHGSHKDFCRLRDFGLSYDLGLELATKLWYDRIVAAGNPHEWAYEGDEFSFVEKYRGGMARANDRPGNSTALGKHISRQNAFIVECGGKPITVETERAIRAKTLGGRTPYTLDGFLAASGVTVEEGTLLAEGSPVKPEDVLSVLSGPSDTPSSTFIPFGEDKDTLLDQGLRAPSRHVSFHIVDNYLVGGLLSLLHGTGGVGKSTFTQMLLYSAATGVPMLKGHFNPRERAGVPVWMYNHEDSIDDIILSLLAIETHMGDLLEDTAKRRLEAHLSIRSGCETRPDAHLVLSQMIDGKRVPQINPLALDTLRRTIRNKGVKVVSLDPLASLHESEENSMSEMRPLMAALTQLSTSENVSVLLASHDNKEGSDFRGSSTIRDFCRIEWHLQRMDAERADTVGIEYDHVPEELKKYSVVATNRKMTRGGEAKNMGPIALRTVAEVMKVTRDNDGVLHNYPVAVIDVFDRSVLDIQKSDAHKNDLRKIVRALGGEGTYPFSDARTCAVLREKGGSPSKDPGSAATWLREKLGDGAEVDGLVLAVTDTERNAKGRVVKQPSVIVRKNDELPKEGEVGTPNIADVDDFLEV